METANSTASSTWITHLLGNLALVIVLIGGWVKDQGWGGTFVMALQLGAAMLAATLLVLVSDLKNAKTPTKGQKLTVGLITFISAFVIVSIA